MPMTDIAQSPLPSLIGWPRDEAAHDGLPWEIWWISAIVASGSRKFAVHALINHLAGGAVYVGATITDMDRGKEITRHALFEPGKAAIARDQLAIETGLCDFSGSYSDGYRLRADIGEGAGFDLSLVATKPVLYNGGGGQYRFMGTTTTQYSVGFLDVSGTIQFDGEEIAVTGQGWHDRQWDNVKRDNELAFTWFGLCLDNGDAISFFDMADSAAGTGWATVARPDGTHIVTSATTTAKGADVTAAGRSVPGGWTLDLPGIGTRLDIGQSLLSDGAPLYTGVLAIAGTCDGKRVAGYGFCDIVGRIG